MSDVAKRLRQRMCWLCGGDCSSAAGEPGYCPKLEDNEASDEIERLKNAINDLTTDLKDDEVEIGRLRSLLETANNYGASENAARIAAEEELAARTCAVIVSEGGQALACSASVAAAYGTVREERERLRAEVVNWRNAEADARALRAGADAACEFVAAERDRLLAEVAALNLALENSGTRHEYTAPPGMVFVPKGFMGERDRLLELLRETSRHVGNRHIDLHKRIDAALKDGS